MSDTIMKVLKIGIKALARPAISYFSYYNKVHMENSSNFLMKFLRKKLIGIGQKFNFYSQTFNRKMFRLNNEKPINPLTENLALERGVELIAEVIIYTIIVVLPCNEIIKSAKRSSLKEEKKDNEYIEMREKLNQVVQEYYSIMNEINNLEKELKQINNEIHFV